MKIRISISRQTLELCSSDGRVLQWWPVSTASKGAGEVSGSYCTLEAANPGRDWILTRILWLSGCELGRNRLGNVDTMRRYIYIHGSPDSAAMGEPGSHGCIRMRNADIVELFDRVPVGTPVTISESD